jgi:5'-nucleotidase
VKILVTNDDGYDAAGLAALQQAVRDFGEIVVVAPKENNSYIGHRVTVHKQMQLEKVRDDFWVLDGTPADCVRVALKALGQNFDLVVSGINHGGNLGADVYASGTVAAAREAFFLGVPSVAFSQFRRGSIEDVMWEVAGERSRRALAYILEKPTDLGYWSVNLPWPSLFSDPVEVCECENELSAVAVEYTWCPERKHVSFRGDYQNRPRQKGKEISSCIDDHIITIVQLG